MNIADVIFCLYESTSAEDVWDRTPNWKWFSVHRDADRTPGLHSVTLSGGTQANGPWEAVALIDRQTTLPIRFHPAIDTSPMPIFGQHTIVVAGSLQRICPDSGTVLAEYHRGDSFFCGTSDILQVRAEDFAVVYFNQPYGSCTDPSTCSYCTRRA